MMQPISTGFEQSTPLTTAPVGPLGLQFLAWLAVRPRSYAETMEAWRTSCPRLSVWEDALGADLIRIDGAGRGGAGQSSVTLTPLGRAVLAKDNGRL